MVYDKLYVIIVNSCLIIYPVVLRERFGAIGIHFPHSVAAKELYITNYTSYQELPNHMKDHPFQTMGFSWTFMDFSYDFDQPKWSKLGISRFSH